MKNNYGVNIKESQYRKIYIFKLNIKVKNIIRDEDKFIKKM